MRRTRFRRPSASAIAAAVVLLPVLSLVFLSFTIGRGEGSGSGEREDVVLSSSRVHGIQPGTSQAQVERLLGKGTGALDYVDTGIAVEPMDASCIYYRARQDSFNDVAQFCFRDDELVSRRIFIAPRS